MFIFAVFDASGRYNGQFFFGNDFWLGSYRLCQEMDDERFRPQNEEKTLPFSVKFNVAKVHLAIHNYTSQVQYIYFCNVEVSVLYICDDDR